MLSCVIESFSKSSAAGSIFFKNLQLMTRAFFGNLRIGPYDPDYAMGISWGLAALTPHKRGLPPLLKYAYMAL